MIFIIGCGTLGSRTAAKLEQYEVMLIDHDVVEEKNLSYQLYSPQDVGLSKAESLSRRSPTHQAKQLFIDEKTIQHLQEAEVIIDCTDNLHSRMIIGDFCAKEGICLIHGAAAGSRGIVARLTRSPSLREFYHDKVSMEDCRSNEIHLRVAERIALLQSRLAQDALEGDESNALFLIYPDVQEEIQLTKLPTRNAGEYPFTLTYCTRRECYKLSGMQHLYPKLEELETLHCSLDEDEILISSQHDIDNIMNAARLIFDQHRE